MPRIPEVEALSQRPWWPLFVRPGSSDWIVGLVAEAAEPFVLPFRRGVPAAEHQPLR